MTYNGEKTINWVLTRYFLVVKLRYRYKLSLGLNRIQFSVSQRSVQVKSFVQFWMHPFGIRVFFVCIRECNASHQSLRQLLKVYMFLGGLKLPLEQVRLWLHVHKLLSSLAFK